MASVASLADVRRNDACSRQRLQLGPAALRNAAAPRRDQQLTRASVDEHVRGAQTKAAEPTADEVCPDCANVARAPACGWLAAEPGQEAHPGLPRELRLLALAGLTRAAHLGHHFGGHRRLEPAHVDGHGAEGRTLESERARKAPHPGVSGLRQLGWQAERLGSLASVCDKDEGRRRREPDERLRQQQQGCPRTSVGRTTPALLEAANHRLDAAHVASTGRSELGLPGRADQREERGRKGGPTGRA
mmetsp:Transcript_12606/g.41502  ORF Transcript_12606/g.41502 Transcript_12606/m.41502 type:complete len:246 (+) Transcript_12606:610-1347(+)